MQATIASRPGILAPAYVVGEEEHSIDTLTDRQALLGKYQMPDNPRLWGWDRYRKSQSSGVELAAAAARRTFERSGLQPHDVDALILCCGEAFGYHAQDRFTGELSRVLGLRRAFVTWAGGTGCASLFSAVQLARALVQGGMCRNVLVIAVNKMEGDEQRFQRYGVFSDGACSLIVCSGAVDHTILALEVSSALPSLGGPGQDLAEKCQLIGDVFERLHQQTAFTADDCVLLGSNVFLPIQDLELSVMPLDGVTTYRGNTARYGHCASADPIINLIDYFAESAPARMRHALLAATAHGHFAAMLLQPQRRPADGRADASNRAVVSL